MTATHTNGRRAAVARAPLAAAIWMAMSSLAFAQDSAPAAEPESKEESGDERALETITVTAQKRSENLQEVPISIQVLGNEQLEEMSVADFDDVVRLIPSVSLQRLGEVPSNTQVYMRGVASGGDGNHSASQPSVGVYVDEQPVTTIRGAIDVHMYDIERVEALAGPQGTLYGASSQAGTLRIITNKPDPTGFSYGYSGELNSIHDGDSGSVAEGFVNFPINDSAAIRLVGWSRKDAGYVDNALGERTFPSSGITIDNAGRARDDYNYGDAVGGRAAIKIDLDDNWSIMPTVMTQSQRIMGSFGVDPDVGELATNQYYPQTAADKWVQAALTVQGKVGNFDVTYAFSHLNRDLETESDYNDYAFWYDTLFGYGTYFYDDAGELVNPSQYIQAFNEFKRRNHEFRIASPADSRLRFVAGYFWQQQSNDIEERYLIDDLAHDLEVPGWTDTIWLTEQDRQDHDEAFFGEVSYDFTDKLTATVGARFFKVENSLKGFFGFGAGYSSGTGEAACFDQQDYEGAPCINLDKSTDEDDALGRVNLSYQIDEDRMVYFTWSEGYRPGGINRRGSLPPYLSDFLTNWEVGWKSVWLDDTLVLNGALFHQNWDDFQFPVLGQNGLTEIKNANQARIRGFEADLNWAASYNWRISSGIALYDAELTENYCGFADANGNPETNCAEPQAPEGSRLPITAKFKGNVTARYTFDVGNYEAHVQGALIHEGRRKSDLRVEIQEILGDLDAYELFDLSAGFRRDNWSVDFYIKNLFDERAELSKFTQCPEAVCGDQTYTVVAQPRTFGVRFSQNF
jgi:outer membrane receptor protein involved in Fe transport